jgi:hypothetical protein
MLSDDSDSSDFFDFISAGVFSAEVFFVVSLLLLNKLFSFHIPLFTFHKITNPPTITAAAAHLAHKGTMRASFFGVGLATSFGSLASIFSHRSSGTGASMSARWSRSRWVHWSSRLCLSV